MPGLKMAADPESAHRLVSRHVLSFPSRRLRVERIRYRPGSRAVLRHKIGTVKLYARVMRPTAIPIYFKAGELADQSGFALPRLAGHWEDGATIWLSEIPGRNLRGQIRRAHQPNPTVLLDGLQRLWNTPSSTGVRPFPLPGLYNRAKRSIGHALKDDHQTLQNLNSATRVLDPFIKAWHPSGIAHNDFYDDQMLGLPDGLFTYAYAWGRSGPVAYPFSSVTSEGEQPDGYRHPKRGLLQRRPPPLMAII